jgi:hypothetical protein
MNKNVVFIIFTVLVALGFGGVILLLLLRPDASAVFIQYSLTVLALVASFAGTVYAFGKQEKRLDTIEANTNGNLTAARNEKAALEAQLLAVGIVPVTTAKVGDPAPTLPSAPVVSAG